MAEPRSEEEDTAIINAFGSFPHFWLGMNDLDSEGTFVYESDGSEVTYFNWGSGEFPAPNNGEGIFEEDCVHYWIDYGAWNDAECTFSLEGYVCQIDL